jgi:hypothetical protein
MEKGTKVNVNLTTDQKVRLGINFDIQNPCEVTGQYTNGFDGHYVKDSGNHLIGCPSKYIEVI